MPRRRKPRAEGARATLSLPDLAKVDRENARIADQAGLAKLAAAKMEEAIAAEKAEKDEWESQPLEPFADEDGPEPIDLSAPPNPVPGDDGAALLRIRDYFIAKHPDDWEAWKLCPLQHGLEAMAGKLRGA